ncbi:hypothetical protein [Flexithrix dorotheae]|uniref:hypothetical protein n=1 Tax=Flexithrix dorotheae TaxID=70993 RepID=UPI00036F356D|nr:hypothetical protein [Flexithrix dorotheae]
MRIGFILLCFLIWSCNKGEEPQLEKITFDLSLLNKKGVYGPPNGLRALDYEFCIPKNETFKKEVLSIDPGVKIHEESKGRIACSENEFLCIGNTHQEGHRQILEKLTTLHYIKRIDQCFYE